MKQLLTISLALCVAATTALSAEFDRFSVQVSGHGRPMILIPGLASSGEVWDGTVEHFKNRHTCHVLTLAGFAGAPAKPVGEGYLTSVREEIARYIRENRLERPIVVGHSLGAFLALDLAASHPDLPGAIVLVDGLPFFFGVMQPNGTVEDARRISGAMAANYGQLDRRGFEQMVRGGPNGSTMAAGEADLERIIAWGLASDGATVAQAMADMLTTDLRPALGRIQVPALALAAWIGYAPYASHESIKRTYGEQYASLAGVRIEITDTARHFIMLDEPEWMHTAIDGFIGSIAQPAAGVAR